MYPVDRQRAAHPTAYEYPVCERYETEIAEIRHVNIANPQTQGELERFVDLRRRAVTASKGNAEWNKRREQFYLFVWVWIGRVARIMLVVGIGFLLAFAIKNF